MNIDYKQVFERMLRAGNFKNSSEMARMLGMTPQAISNHRKRGELSAGFIIRFAQKCDISVDWLLTGSGQATAKAGGEPVESGRAAVAMVGTGVGQGAQCAEWSDACVTSFERRKASESALLCPDEIIYVGKLLKILRSGQVQAPPALKASIDAIMGAVYPESHRPG